MSMSIEKTRDFLAVLLVLVLVSLDLCFGSGLGMSPAHGDHGHHHHCSHGHHHQHDHDHHQHRRVETEEMVKKGSMLPEELAEEEDMKLYGFGPYRDDHDHHHRLHDHQDLSGFGLWLHALGCSLLVSLASLICLIILPVIFIQGKPSRAVVDLLALFGAGAMLGDAFLHQLPHAFGGAHSHSHDEHVDHAHHAHTGQHDQKHAHSLKDLSVGLSILAGIVLFLLVEKVVRYIEENSRGVSGWSHSHHHHHHNSNKKLKNDDDDVHADCSKSLGDKSDGSLHGENATQYDIRKPRSAGTCDDKSDKDPADVAANSVGTLVRKETSQSPSSLVFGYLNLFSDGVHNFTDGMALGSAFLLYGSIGGWSRTLFLLAHELPQEVGDFGILVRSGFSVSKALFFNFLSALVALAGTAVALLLGQDPGQSSLIEGFTAGGFIYIAVAGVLAEMNNNSSTTLKNTALQLISLTFGMVVALCISLVE